MAQQKEEELVIPATTFFEKVIAPQLTKKGKKLFKLATVKKNPHLEKMEGLSQTEQAIIKEARNVVYKKPWLSRKAKIKLVTFLVVGASLAYPQRKALMSAYERIKHGRVVSDKVLAKFVNPFSKKGRLPAGKAAATTTGAAAFGFGAAGFLKKKKRKQRFLGAATNVKFPLAKRPK